MRKSKKQQASKSILFGTSILNNVKYGEKEGERLINVSLKSNLLLGRLLSPLHTSNTTLFCGKVGKLRTFMRAIKTPGFPLDLLDKSNYSAEDASRIPKEQVELPNYWAIVAQAVVERVRQDKKLMDLLKANTLELTCLEGPKEVIFAGKKIEGHMTIAKNMAAYISIIRNIEFMLKDGTFDNDEVVNKFIMDCRDDPEKDIFDNIQIPVNIVNENKDVK